LQRAVSPLLPVARRGQRSAVVAASRGSRWRRRDDDDWRVRRPSSRRRSRIRTKQFATETLPRCGAASMRATTSTATRVSLSQRCCKSRKRGVPAGTNYFQASDVPLFIACTLAASAFHACDLSVSRLLLERGADPDRRRPPHRMVPDSPGTTALFHVCDRELFINDANIGAVVRLLLQHGASTSLTFNLTPTSLKRRSLSALYAACYDRRIEATRQLLLFDPEMIHVANEEGTTPPQVVRGDNSPEMRALMDQFLLPHYSMRIHLHVVGPSTGHRGSARHGLVGERNLLRHAAGFLALTTRPMPPAYECGNRLRYTAN